MKIFVSHATKNKDIVLKFAEFVEAINSDIKVFCTSEKGSIVGESNFVDEIFHELDDSDLFIPVLSNEYYESKFCMIELGVAYSYLCNKYERKDSFYIAPFALYPLKKGEALSDTPISAMQVIQMEEKEDVKTFLEYLKREQQVHIGAGLNKKLDDFETEIGEIYKEKQDMIKAARIEAYFDDKADYEQRKDIVDYTLQEQKINIRYNQKPLEDSNSRIPNFIGLAMKYADGMNLGVHLKYNKNAKFEFCVYDDEEVLKSICVEFKYGDVLSKLGTFVEKLDGKETLVSIPLKQMESKALNKISEICFVIRKEDIQKTKGKFAIGNIQIS